MCVCYINPILEKTDINTYYTTETCYTWNKCPPLATAIEVYLSNVADCNCMI